MNKKLVLPIVLFIIIIAGIFVLILMPSKQAFAPTTVTPVQNGNPLYNLIRPTLPVAGSAIESPVTISGEARGTWYFEASFPVEILDANGKSIAQGPAQAQSDWMTEEFVPFTISLPFPKQPTGSKGTIVLHKDNPSGEPERDQQTSVSITFK